MATNVKTIYGPARRITGTTTLYTYKGEPFDGVKLECGHKIPAFIEGRHTSYGRARCSECLRVGTTLRKRQDPGPKMEGVRGRDMNFTVADNIRNGRTWLCIEERGDGSYVIHGDTGRGGFTKPFWPKNCEFGGWLNHQDDCGWYAISETARPKNWRTA